VMSLTRQLPSAIPDLEEILNRVTQDYQIHEATLLAQSAGTNFAVTLAVQEAVGKNFVSTCVAAGLQPQTLPPFSLGTQSLPELGDHASYLTQLKQSSFGTPVGRSSQFELTEDGGFIVHVQSRQPVDPAVKKNDLPQYTVSLRRQRQSEAFNAWLQAEASRELTHTPLFTKQAAGGAASAN